MPQMFPCFWALLMLSLSALFMIFMTSMSSNLIFFFEVEKHETSEKGKSSESWIET